MTVTLALPWPDPVLTPHAKGHWRTKAKATKAARHLAAFWTVRQGGKGYPGPHDLHLTYSPPDNRRRDVHNVHGAVKAYLDGIADALGVDDSTFRAFFPAEFGPVKAGGEIWVRITTREATE